MVENYIPSREVLDKYADVLVNFALNSGDGVKKDEVVFLEVPEVAKPLLVSLRNAVLKAGANPVVNFIPSDMDEDFYNLAEGHQLDFFPGKYLKGKVDEADHFISIRAETNVRGLECADFSKVIKNRKSLKPYFNWKKEKESRGMLTKTLALYGTDQMAKEAGLKIEDYWQQIIKACYLDQEDPVSAWRDTRSEIRRVLDKLNNLKIDLIRINGKDVNLEIKIGDKRKWLGGRGRNIPSFEVFISPDYRGTNGEVKFNQPLYRFGRLIKGIKLKFENGEMSEFSAEEGEDAFREIINSDAGSKRIGEFSLTDKRLSKIDRFMATTLYDENYGGESGNFHIALGSAYKDSFLGDRNEMTKEDWDKNGFNESGVHVDIVSTNDREVVAVLSNGEEKLIYKDGMFLL